jgi:hypothetical protein
LKQVAKTTRTIWKQSFVKLNPLYLCENIKIHNFEKRQLFSFMKWYFHTILSKVQLEITFCIFSPMVQYKKWILQFFILILNYENQEKTIFCQNWMQNIYILEKANCFQCTILSNDLLSIIFCISSMVRYDFLKWDNYLTKSHPVHKAYSALAPTQYL